MADPATWAAVLSIATTAISYQQSNAAADAQAKQAAEAADANNKAAWANYESQKSQLQVQSNEINLQTSNELSERAKSAAIEQARIRSISAESGVSGLSVSTLLADSMFQEGQDRDATVTNNQSRLVQNNNELQSARSRAVSASNSGYTEAARTTTMANNSRTSALSAGLQIAGAGATYGDKKGWGKTTRGT